MDARALDVNVDVLRWVLSGLAAMIAAQVSVSGGVGWVRLIVPHLARLLVWPDRSRLLPTAVVLGGLYHLARAMYSQVTDREIPIGFRGWDTLRVLLRARQAGCRTEVVARMECCSRTRAPSMRRTALQRP